MRRDLMLHPSPDFISVPDRRRGTISPRPTAQRQTRLLTACEDSQPIRALVEAFLEVISVNGLQMTCHLYRVQKALQTANCAQPSADHSVGQTSRSVLTQRTLSGLD